MKKEKSTEQKQNKQAKQKTTFMVNVKVVQQNIENTHRTDKKSKYNNT